MHKYTEKKINEWLPYINNSRTHSPKQVNQIASSIKEFGFTNPILIDELNMVIAGHGRLLASQKLGLKNIPCIILNGLSEAQKKAYVIADNKLALNAGWDEVMFANEIAHLQEMDFNIDLLGFSADEINAIVEAHAEPIEGLSDADDCPELPVEPVTIDGDIWVLGNHRLMCGDSTDAGSVSLLMGGKNGMDIWRIARTSKNDLHPTIKPVTLVNKSIIEGSQINGICLDLFGGSGTTMITCEKNNRHAYLMELDIKYCDIIIKRWQDFTGKEAVLEVINKTFKEVENDRKP